MIHGQPTTNTFFSVVIHGISSDFKIHLVLPLALVKLDLLGSGDIVEKVFESVSAALPGKRIAVTTTNNGPNMVKGMRDGRIGRWPCAAHMLNRIMIKSTMEKVDNSSVELLPRVLRAVKFNPALQKGMEERGIKKINDYPETRWGYIYMCQGHLREVGQAVR